MGAEVIILGCTELPLLFPNESEIRYDDNMISLIDPTLVLAKKIVAFSSRYLQILNAFFNMKTLQAIDEKNVEFFYNILIKNAIIKDLWRLYFQKRVLLYFSILILLLL